MKVLTFNGLRFMELSSNAGQSITGAHGFYRETKNGIHLYKLDRQLEAYIVRNKRQGYFVVTASTHSDGRAWYMYSTCSTTEKWLGIEGRTILGQYDLVMAARIDEESGTARDPDLRGVCPADTPATTASI